MRVKAPVMLLLLISVSSVNAETALSFVKPQYDFKAPLNKVAKTEDDIRRRNKVVKAILGKKDKSGVRSDLVEKIKDIASGNRRYMGQMHVYLAAHDAFLISDKPLEAYNAYLMMDAVKNCMSSFKRLGRSGANEILLRLVEAKVDTDIRKMAMARAESLLESYNFPPLMLHDNYSDYCQYTNFGAG